MFDWLKSTKKKLQNQTTEKKIIDVPVKKAFYHEIVQESLATWLVRLYNRQTGEVEVFTTASKGEAMNKALSLMTKYNGG